MKYKLFKAIRLSIGFVSLMIGLILINAERLNRVLEWIKPVSERILNASDRLSSTAKRRLHYKGPVKRRSKKLGNRTEQIKHRTARLRQGSRQLKHRAKRFSHRVKHAKRD